jgi:phosphoserine phosphatase
VRTGIVVRVYDAVIFDLDDTLIVEEASARSSLREVAALVPGADPDVFVETVLTTAKARWTAGPAHAICRELGFASWEGLGSTFEGNDARVDQLRTWVPSYRSAVWAEALATFGADDPELVAVVAKTYESAQRAGHPLLDGAERTVRRLAEKRPIGLLTNGPSDIQRWKLAGTGLADLFGTVAISGELGRGKPDPAVFDHVLERLGTGRSHTVMVGDSWERDVQGAVAAGIDAVWISWGRAMPESLPGVTAVDAIDGLPSLVG